MGIAPAARKRATWMSSRSAGGASAYQRDPASGGHSRAVLEVLHAERHPGERAEWFACEPGTIDIVGRGERTLGVDVHERVQCVLCRRDPVE